ncbi:carnitine O-acetyltransferase isoform X2 [Rhagoletis pomonella]|nr:carnitine O-acetyltransferase isoform X2 [Rhagoletis pomonella]XP_036321460.1 carnitine O-acetyltransferase isoform X2 [Rhagoletis pomonella]XP_036321461.1 carnitine O-acetyltransferase isoform X2 [Rhagoletis pomonella]XP_036321462.1 carnitine O-acetyltransferase isoform X2 [Rhagoletis pomonella]XP_036321464.1 carnitine O-acetyltransferase isoform X2 [Rhagoletis pomonella]
MQFIARRVAMNLTKTVLASSLKTPLPSIAAAVQKSLPDARFYSISEGPQKQNLLRYPAFPLKDTLETFLKTVEPVINACELVETKEAIKKFEAGEGAELQKLLEKAAICEENWLAKRWLRAAYLQYRAPVTVFVSPGMTFPPQRFENDEDFLNYAGKVVYSMARYKQIIDAGEIPVLKMGKYELDNSQFGKVYGTCRIPQKVEDALEYNPKSLHVVVLYKNHFYKVQIYNNNGVALHPDILVKQFKTIMEAEAKKGVEIGVLSTDNRDNWAQAYEELLKIDGNKELVKTIQSALFTVSLDECFDVADDQFFNELSGQLIHGGGVKLNSANRWMDKTIQLILNRNGMSGFCYEHSPAEGQPIANITDYVTNNLCNEKHYEQSARDNYPCPEKLKLKANKTLNQYIEKSKKNLNELAENLHVNVLHFKDYGKGFLKKQKHSPDSYIQIALQYAYYKLHKVPAAQYESAHLRIYIYGRTETIRSCSNESLAFAKAMEDACVEPEERVELLRTAINAHRAYTTAALQGRGVDRHLLGLKLMAIENNKPIPEFFNSPGYVKSLVFRVSTSQVATPNLGFMVYGPAADDGYACCYNPRENDIILACTCWRDNHTSNVDTFVCTLREALLEMQQLLVGYGKAPAAKL